MAMHLSVRRHLSVSLAALVGLAVVAGAVHFSSQIDPELETVPGPKSAAGAPELFDGIDRTAEVRAESQAETRVGYDAKLAVLPERAPDADRVLKASSGDNPHENLNENAASQAAAFEPAVPEGQLTAVRQLVEPRVQAEPSNMVAPALAAAKVEPASAVAMTLPVRAPRPANAETTARSARALFERGTEIKLKKDANLYITARNIPENDRLLEAYNADRPNGGRVQTRAGEAAAVPGLLGIANQAYRAQDPNGQNDQTYTLADAMRDAIWRKNTAARLKSLTLSHSACADGVARKIPSIGLIASC